MAGECKDKVALVTGASRGIGAAIAERLAAEGARVAAVARSLDTHPPKLPGTLVETVTRIEARGGTAVAIQGDVMDGASRRRFALECRRRLGPIDILVNNAAFGPYRRFLDLGERDFQGTLEANLHAPFALCQLVLPDMVASKCGWILNISSATAFHPAKPPYIEWERSGGYHLYAASKAALDRLSTGLAAEFYAQGIAVNALAPVAAVITPGVEATDVGKWIEPSMIEPVEAMAEAALALCSGDPATLTGRVVYSVRFLEEIGRPIRTLDGRALHAASGVARR
jgi:NAD(P)-dependent dehydrogenase (short-subunit alcohol dehydrogenase family)